jgi:hypothetical protein
VVDLAATLCRIRKFKNSELPSDESHCDFTPAPPYKKKKKEDGAFKLATMAFFHILPNLVLFINPVI